MKLNQAVGMRKLRDHPYFPIVAIVGFLVVGMIIFPPLRVIGETLAGPQGRH